MKRCVAMTKSGHRCRNAARHGSCCSSHKNEPVLGDGLAMLAGAVAANLIAPGLGIAFVGGLAGKLMRDIGKDHSTGKKRVFVSFDFDNDRGLKDLILGQTRHPDLEFDVIDHSLHEAAPEKTWQNKARHAIARADIVLVMVGQRTYKAQGVLKEIEMARELGVQVVQIIGYRGGDYTPVEDAGRLYRWSHENLKKLLG